MESITCLSLIDPLNAIHEARIQSRTDMNEDDSDDFDELGWPLQAVDKRHVYRTTSLILRCGGLSVEENPVPSNVYSRQANVIPVFTLDRYSLEIGKYLLMRYAVREKMFGLSPTDEPKVQEYEGHVDLMNRAKKSKSVTMKRVTKGKTNIIKSERQEKEEKRQKAMVKEVKQLNCLSSEMNACQALVTPDCSKPKVLKSLGMKKAINEMIEVCKDRTNEAKSVSLLNQVSLPQSLGVRVNCNYGVCRCEIQGTCVKW